jgi:uncharacterized protein
VPAEALQSKYEMLRQSVRKGDHCAVAVSGGVDSTLLLKVVCDELGKDRVLALFAHSILQPAGEREHVVELVGAIGCRLEIIAAAPLDWPEFVKNPSNRCYRCKKKIYSFFKEKLAQFNIPRLMDGTNADDLGDTRPGLKALAELEVLTPLADVGFHKQEIRRLSRHLGLPNWNRPSASCLATRIPAGRAITQALLEQVARCEEVLHSLGFFGCRARLAGDSVLVELASGDTSRFVDASVKEEVVRRLSAFGVDKVLLNLTERSN